MSGLTVSCWAEREFTYEPERTALLVIDMQRHFLEPTETGDGETADAGASESALGPTQVTSEAAENPIEEAGGGPDAELVEYVDTRDIIPDVARLLFHARKLGCRIVHTREGYSSDLSDVSSFRRDLDYVGHDGALGRSLIRGEPGHDFVDELQPVAGEIVIDKASFSAFHQTNLHEQLQAAGTTHLILCGVTTQCCVHSTLREAVDLGYWCLTVADCCAASESELHEAALMIIMGEGHLFGWIADVDEIEAADTNSVVP